MSLPFQEDQHTEFKENPKSGTIVNEIVAFLNTCDGDLYIGVKDDGTVVGLDDVDKVSLFLSNIIADQIEPNPRGLVRVDTPSVSGKKLVHVHVNKGSDLYYVKKYGMSSAGCFERIGTSCRGMIPEQIRSRFIQALKIPEKKMVDTASSLQHLSFSKFKIYLSAKGVHYVESRFDEAFHLRTPDGKYNLLAQLLADENDTSIKVAIFKGKTKADYLKRNEYGFTCLLYAMEQVSEYCLALNDTFIDVSHFERKEKKRFDEDAFREAWVNAVVHNKWVNSVPPAVYWYEDRLEIVSYGSIPKGMSKEEFLSGKSDPVNPELMQIFLQCHIVEQTGHGVPKVVRKYGPSAYEFGKSIITVTIPFEVNGFGDVAAENATVNPENASVNSKNASVNCKNASVNCKNASVNATVKLNKTEEKVLDILKVNGSITAGELAFVVQKHWTTVTRVLNKLREKGLILRIGSDKTGHWEVQEDKLP